jgi:hypothetical protein
MDRRAINVFSFVEELAMSDGRQVSIADVHSIDRESETDMQVVDGESGIINDGRERRDTIHADHVNMVKFSDRKDDGYGKVLYALEQLLKRLPGNESALAGLGT